MSMLAGIVLAGVMALMPMSPEPGDTAVAKDKYYYCEWCGHRFPSVRHLSTGSCVRHPDGPNRGYHKLYEGSEKSEYTCKYCGKCFPSIMVMAGSSCANHPDGEGHGRHVPTL